MIEQQIKRPQWSLGSRMTSQGASLSLLINSWPRHTDLPYWLSQFPSVLCLLTLDLIVWDKSGFLLPFQLFPFTHNVTSSTINRSIISCLHLDTSQVGDSGSNQARRMGQRGKLKPGIVASFQGRREPTTNMRNVPPFQKRQFMMKRCPLSCGMEISLR